MLHNVQWKKSGAEVVRIVIILAFLVSSLVRLYVVNFAEYNCAPHDLGPSYGTENYESRYEGHLGYIWSIKMSGGLSQDDPRERTCFYNPPLFYALEAGVWNLAEELGVSDNQAHELLQWIPFLAVELALLVMILIMKEVGVGGYALALASILLLFHPEMTILSIIVNPDAMSLMFSVLSIYFMIRWYKAREGKMLWMVLDALAIGLGMMTKLTVVLVAIPMAVFFLYELVNRCRREGKAGFLDLFKQYLVFLLISVPLGLYWSVRNFLKFRLSPTYVPLVTDDSIKILDENSSLLKRLNPLAGYYDISITWDTARQYNIWKHTLQTSLIDEYYLPWNMSLLRVMMYLAVFLSLVLTVFFIIGIFKKRDLSAPLRLFLAGFYLLYILYYVRFCFNFPHLCTMNYRYIPVTLLFAAIGLGWFSEEDKRAEEEGRRTRGSRIISRIALLGSGCGILLFSVGAVLLWFLAL